MAPSQLKALKASLHERGLRGQQQSKKKQRQGRQNGSHAQRAASLALLREQFNPFEVKQLKQAKYDVAQAGRGSELPGNARAIRPSLSKAVGEEKRRSTLLVEMQQRRKVGGVLDRRFGEDNPTMTPEEKAVERFVREKERHNRKNAIFDLEDEGETNGLTHLGQSLSADTAPLTDDFREDFSGPSDDEWAESERARKRQRLSDAELLGDQQDLEGKTDSDDKPRSRNEIMKEVVKKSKLYKFERQQAKEDDDDLRAELDQGLPDLYTLVRGHPKTGPENLESDKSQPRDLNMNPDRLALLNGKDRAEADQEYDKRLRQMAMEQRAIPTSRTLTTEEKSRREADRLRDLESERLKRMSGDAEQSDSDNSIPEGMELQLDDDDTTTYGLGKGLSYPQAGTELGVEDEDEFIMEDLVASEFEPEDSSDDGEENSSTRDDANEDEDAEFNKGLLSNEDHGREKLFQSTNPKTLSASDKTAQDIPFTFPCPTSHAELLQITKDIPLASFPIAIQRIRALYQPHSAKENKTKLGIFSQILVQHLSFLANSVESPSEVTLEAIIRHIHSLSKTYPTEIGQAFREHLQAIHEQRPSSLKAGDLVVLTAIGSIFSTSDHFHPVATPSMLCMTRYLEQRTPQSLSELTAGIFVCSLCLHYQRLSKRYVPEAVNYIGQTMTALMPIEIEQAVKILPKNQIYHDIRIKKRAANGGNEEVQSALPSFWATRSELSSRETIQHAQALLRSSLLLVNTMVDLWAEKSAFCEIFDPLYQIICTMSSEASQAMLNREVLESLVKCKEHLSERLAKSQKDRKPLRLHNHRPQAIKTFIPKFEDSYNPDKRYDHDADRAELSKLKAEHKKERKGALRELRKDASFLARETLKEKKEKDAAYEKKFKRLVAEIQGEEGREANVYEKEKKQRKSKP